MAWHRKDDKALSEPMVLYTNEKYYGITPPEAFYHSYFYMTRTSQLLQDHSRYKATGILVRSWLL